MRLPPVPYSERRRVRGVRTIDVSENERARLRDAVDDGLVEREVINAERLVEVRESCRELPSQSMSHVNVQLLELVVDLGERRRSRQRTAGDDVLHVDAFRITEVVRHARLGLAADPRWRRV